MSDHVLDELTCELFHDSCPYEELDLLEVGRAVRSKAILG
jgi:hypothetical protein